MDLLKTRAVEAWNAKVTDIIGPISDKKDKDNPWGVLCGVELEYEIPAKSKFVDTLSQELIKRKTDPAKLFARDEYKNTILAHIVAANLKKSLVNLGIVKRDGSLKNGVEITSMPMSLNNHRNGKWEEFFKTIKNSGVQVKPTCGMHVHISREFITQPHIGRIVSFLYNPINIEFIKIVAGRRPPEKYANLTDCRKITDVNRLTNRYSALNINNPNTIEFRIFKATTKQKRMFANMEFCVALVCFTWPGYIGNIECASAISFIQFIRANRKQYLNLYELLKSKRLIS